MKNRDASFDLGRLCVLLAQIADLDLFDLPNCRTKDFSDWFNALSEEDKSDFIHQLPYNIEMVNDKISECICIARAHDDLNCSHE